LIASDDYLGAFAVIFDFIFPDQKINIVCCQTIF